MTFVRRRGFSRRIRDGRPRGLNFDFPGHFRVGYGARSRHSLLLYMGQRFDDSTTNRIREATEWAKIYRERRGRQAYPPSFLQDVLLLRPF